MSAAVLSAALLMRSAARAQTYPPPSQPGPVQSRPKGPHHTFKVCKKCALKTIQDAVNKAKAGDTITLAHATCREAVKINGKAKRYLTLVGNPSHPEKVVLRAKGKMQNAVF